MEFSRQNIELNNFMIVINDLFLSCTNLQIPPMDVLNDYRQMYNAICTRFNRHCFTHHLYYRNLDPSNPQQVRLTMTIALLNLIKDLIFTDYKTTTTAATE